MILSYSITKGIGVGIISYVLIATICYLIDLIKYGMHKNEEGYEKPKYEVSIVAWIVCLLFVVYFIVPVAL
jgi:hypothetical protein